MSTQINVVIADDHQFLREGFCAALSKKRFGISVLGEARNGKELIELCKKVQPDVVFTDIQMPVMDGIQACKAIKTHYPETGVIALSMFDDEFLIIDMLNAGANGYLLKDTHPLEVSKAAKAVYTGGSYFCEAITEKVNKIMVEMKPVLEKKKEKADLSEREVEIIKLTCEEYSNKEIADKLDISHRTVEGHKERIHLKIGTNKLAGLITYAIKHKLFKIK
jgi:DNA-binding NarL/FixJ family response regulator